VTGVPADDVGAEDNETDKRQAKDDQADQGQAHAAASQLIEAMPNSFVQGLSAGTR
jgi:hypothetical protein